MRRGGWPLMTRTPIGENALGRTRRGSGPGGRLRFGSAVVAAALLAAWAATAGGVTAAASATGAAGRALADQAAPGQPDFGPNVYIFSPSMPQAQIQATVDSIASQQVSNQFGPQRYAL